MSIIKKKRIWNHKTSRRHTVKSRLLMSKRQKGRIPWNKGKKNIYSKEIIEKQKSYHFLNGKPCISEYPIEWTETLKESIRQRDDYTCFICGVHQDEMDRKIEVHHIDYNKNNCCPSNLITLCVFHHRQTNHNREYWMEFFVNSLN